MTRFEQLLDETAQHERQLEQAIVKGEGAWEPLVELMSDIADVAYERGVDNRLAYNQLLEYLDVTPYEELDVDTLKRHYSRFEEVVQK